MSFFRDWENSVHYRLPQEWNRANFSYISRNFAMTYAFFEGGSTDNDLHQSTKLLALWHCCWGSEVDKTPSSSSSSPSKFAICYSHFRCRFTTLGYPLSAPYLPQHFTPSTLFWAKWPSFGLILSLLRACACLWLFGKAFSISYKTIHAEPASKWEIGFSIYIFAICFLHVVSSLKSENLEDHPTASILNFLFRVCILRMQVQQIGGHRFLLRATLWFNRFW